MPGIGVGIGVPFCGTVSAGEAVPANARVTEDGQTRVTEDGQTRVTES